MWKSPIEIIANKWATEVEDGVVSIVRKYGINVDKEELMKALEYDRDQWERGYADGRMDGYNKRDEEIVRCRECKWWGDIGCAINIVDKSDNPKEDDFCSFGERRDDAKIH